jgi:cullin 3
VSATLTQIQVERDGHVINRSAVKGCVDVFLSLKTEPEGPSVYTQYLEPAILKASEAFYKAEGQRLLDSCDTPEYLRRVSV